MFKLVADGFNIEAANFGEANNRVIVFRVPKAMSYMPWEQVEGTRILLIGGEAVTRELRRLLDSSRDGDGFGRPHLQKIIPGGISSRSHTALRMHVGL